MRLFIPKQFSRLFSWARFVLPWLMIYPWTKLVWRFLPDFSNEWPAVNIKVSRTENLSGCTFPILKPTSFSSPVVWITPSGLFKFGLSFWSRNYFRHLVGLLGLDRPRKQEKMDKHPCIPPSPTQGHSETWSLSSSGLKRPIHCQLNWTILLCDVIPDGKTE
jgi:hypothetical protein